MKQVWCVHAQAALLALFLPAGARGGDGFPAAGGPLALDSRLDILPLPLERATRQTGAPAAMDGWEFEFTPYFWAAGMSGKIGVGENEANVDASFSDVFSRFDAGCSARLDAIRRPWFLFLDGAWVRYEQEADLEVLNQSLDSDAEAVMTLAEVAGGYRALEGRGADLAGSGAPTRAWLDLFAGARYTRVAVDLSVDGGPLGGVSEDRTERWVDPFVGTRLHVDLSETWAVRLRNDVGGFSAASDLTWSFDAEVACRVSDAVSLELGYRILSDDFETGTGSEKFVYDVTSSGLLLGLTVRF